MLVRAHTHTHMHAHTHTHTCTITCILLHTHTHLQAHTHPCSHIHTHTQTHTHTHTNKQTHTHTHTHKKRDRKSKFSHFYYINKCQEKRQDTASDNSHTTLSPVIHLQRSLFLDLHHSVRDAVFMHEPTLFLLFLQAPTLPTAMIFLG